MPSRVTPPSDSPLPEHLARLPGVESLKRAASWAAGAGEPLRPHLGDVLTIALALGAALSAVALAGAGRGTLLTPLHEFLGRWLGWGAWLIPLCAAAGAVLLVRTRLGYALSVRWGKIIALEIAALALLGLADAIIGNNLARADGGAGGGLIGWAIGYMLGQAMSSLVRVLLLLAVLVFFGSYGLSLSVERIRAWVERAPRPAAPPSSVRTSPRTIEATPPAPEPARREHIPPPEPEKPAAERSPAPAAKLKAAEAPPARAVKVKRDRHLPSLDIFENAELGAPSIREVNQTAGLIEKTLGEFGIPARVVGYRTGPTVTQFAVEPGFVEKAGADGEARRAKVRVSQISALSDDLALALAAPTLRIEAPVPGQSYVGIEVPHKRSSVVRLRMVMESPGFHKIRSPLAVALGMDVAGQPVSADLATMPHLLIAGTTGSGKSVCITALAACLVANNAPEALRLVLIDPKMVELVRFNGLPHLLGKVETDLTRIVTVLRWCTREMDRRYKLLEALHARHIDDYNRKVATRGEGEPLPRMVVMLDELADLMMMAPDETERTLIRLAQMARATGIHLVVATQRPSTDVVTGLIKANFPARISFAVASGIDSRVILDTPGAESLLGRGDMLYLSPESGSPVRLQGCFVTDREIQRLIDHWKEQGGEPAPEPEPEIEPAAEERAHVLAARSGASPWEGMIGETETADQDEAEIQEAMRVVRQYGRASASLLQRKMRLGYPRAARLMDELHARGIIGREQAGGRTREVLVGKAAPEDDEAIEETEDDEEE
jgi:DNA segregation ATPase FtsK/SpoIIIE, S-DNA-T family